MEKKFHNIMEFNNTERKPLGDLLIDVFEDGIKKRIPALDKHWVNKHDFGTYKPLVCSGGKVKEGVDLEEWIYQTESFGADVHFLLELNQHKFWSYMVFEKSVLRSVISFLQNSTPYYLNIAILVGDDKVKRLYHTTLSDVVRIMCRLITNKESEEEWLEKKHLKDLIYSNYLISIPMMFDLMLACGENNMKTLKKIFETLLIIEPKYEDDIKTALLYFPTVFKRIQIEAENEGIPSSDDKVKITQAAGTDVIFDTPYDDLALYTLDCACSLSLLFDISPQAVKFSNEISMDQRISHFYDNTVPYLYKNICLIKKDAQSISWLDQSRLQFLKAFRAMSYLHIENVLNNTEMGLMSSESFIAMMTQNLSQRTFVIDYQRMYPIEADIDILKQACLELDTFKADYVLKAYKDESDAALAEMIGAVDFQEDQTWPDCEGASAVVCQREVSVPTDTLTDTNHTSNRNYDKEADSILEMFPDLGSGFVRRILNRYDTHEEAISAILEGNLPPDLTNADRTELYIPPDKTEEVYNATGNRRINVFDGDEYDIMTNDNPNCIIKRGKGFPGAPKNLTELLDDKSHVNEMKQRYMAYDLVEEIVTSRSNEYDDEYDDSYEALLEGDVHVRRPHELKKIAAEIMDEESESEEEEDNQDDASKTDLKGRRMNFCENPELIRARYEANRSAKFSGGKNDQSARMSSNVVGNTNGQQGQDKQTVINRHKKDVNKSSRGNHSRKSGASWKRSRGMIPS